MDAETEGLVDPDQQINRKTKPGSIEKWVKEITRSGSCRKTFKNHKIIPKRSLSFFWTPKTKQLLNKKTLLQKQTIKESAKNIIPLIKQILRHFPPSDQTTTDSPGSAAPSPPRANCAGQSGFGARLVVGFALATV